MNRARVYQFRHIRARGGSVARATLLPLRHLAPVPALVLGMLLLIGAGGAGAAPKTATAGALSEVVVTLPQPPLSEAILHDRALATAATPTTS